MLFGVKSILETAADRSGRPGTRLAWLFDIDGTLLTTEGAAREAFAQAVRELLGVEDDLREVAFAGRTEPLILGDILSRHGRTFEDGAEARFWNRVFDHMRDIFVPPRGRLFPGVTALLDTIDRHPDWVMGLLTGNMTEMARIKLDRFGLRGRFRFGAFGEMAENRDALACHVVAHVASAYGVPADRCIVVGDTELDIACARAAGARVVAVATGVHDRERLAARRPDLLLDGFDPPETIVAWAMGVDTGHA